ncbi:MAG: SDR family NAD(P)-dependent oxidoreductase [Saprospiraceae bacterium]
MNTINIAYSAANADLAHQLVHDLQGAGIHFDLLTPPPGSLPGQFAALLQSQTEPILMLITDNFLKDEHCMSGMLQAARSMQRHQSLFLVVADGKEDNKPVPTEYERMVNAIRYMNYWQDIYLHLIENAQHADDTVEREQVEAHMETIRDISMETGDFIKLLREANPVHWPDLQSNHYESFFRQYNLMDRHLAFRVSAPDTPTPVLPPVTPHIEEAKPVELREDPFLRPSELAIAMPPIFFSGPMVPLPVPEDERLLPLYDEEAHVLESLPDADFSETTDKPFLVEEPQTARTLPESSVVYPQEDTDQAVADAHFWFERGDVERGLDAYRESIDRQPQNTSLRMAFLRDLLEYGHDPEAANLQLEVLHEQGLTEVNSYELMGDIAVERGDYLFAKYCWDRVAELKPDATGIFRKLGLLTSEQLSEYKETAVHYLRKAIERQEGNAKVFHRLAALLWDNGQQDAETLSLLEQATAADPSWPQAWIDLADANRHLNRPAEALLAYQKAIALLPEWQTPERDGLFIIPAPETTPPAPALHAIEPAPNPDPVVESETISDAVPASERPNGILTVLVTGATSGIGLATADLFARNGHRVVLVGRREDRLNELKNHFSEYYRNSEVLLVPLDVRDAGAVEKALMHLPEAWQEIDVLINNAGLAKGLSPIHEGNLDHWNAMIDTNIKGLLYVTRCIAPGMVARRKGHIINTGSSAGKEVYKNGNVYCATKFAVNALTQGMRIDLHEYNIRVSQVSPGHVEDTEFALTRFDGDAERARIYTDFQPLKAGDVADAIYFMATRPAHVNVQDIWMYSTQQAASTVINRSGRDD